MSLCEARKIVGDLSWSSYKAFKGHRKEPGYDTPTVIHDAPCVNEARVVASPELLYDLMQSAIYIGACEHIHVPVQRLLITGDEEAAFIKDNNLLDFVSEAVHELAKAFKHKVEVIPRIFADPDNGSKRLVLEVPSDNPLDADRYLTKFCYDWWYNQVGIAGHLVGFDVVPSQKV